MAVKVLQSLKHDGTIYEMGAVIHHLADDVKATLIKSGVIQDLEHDAHVVEQQVKADVATIEQQVHDDGEMVRGQAESLAHQNAQQDVATAQAMLEAEGEPVSESGKPQDPQGPTPEQIAAEAANIQ